MLLKCPAGIMAGQFVRDTFVTVNFWIVTFWVKRSYFYLNRSALCLSDYMFITELRPNAVTARHETVNKGTENLVQMPTNYVQYLCVQGLSNFTSISDDVWLLKTTTNAVIINGIQAKQWVLLKKQTVKNIKCWIVLRENAGVKKTTS